MTRLRGHGLAVGVAGASAVLLGAFGAHALQGVLTADSLSLWQEAGWGFALWNLRGDFGVLDSGRTDVAYEDFKGRKLDRAMLELLRSH